MFNQLVVATSVVWLLGSLAFANETPNQADTHDKKATTHSAGSNSSTISATSAKSASNTESGTEKKKADSAMSTVDAVNGKNVSPAAATTDQKVAAPASAGQAESKPQKKHNKHHRGKHNKGTEVDGEPLGQIGGKKRVDRGFDFENSRQFEKSQSP